jgi:hypothetical protein
MMATLTKPKKINKSKLKQQADTLASDYYRAKTPYCEAQGLDNVKCGGGLQWAHIFTRSILRLRYEPYNNLILCQGHHLYYTYHPIEWVRFLEKNYASRLSEAESRRYEHQKVDFQAWIDHFRQAHNAL